MLGLYALRRFEVREPIAVYIGEDIGEQGGDGDVELERRAAQKRGRHVMQQGRRLVDGKYGPTGAQYVNGNSAYRAPKEWANNARTYTGHRDNSSDEGNQAGHRDNHGLWKRVLETMGGKRTT